MRISACLAGDENRQNRLRTTLAHEYGHVRFHAYLWDLEPPGPDLLKSNPNASMQICYRDNILDAAQTDWMEWQAGYVCGALLCPPARSVSWPEPISNCMVFSAWLAGAICTASR